MLVIYSLTLHYVNFSYVCEVKSKAVKCNVVIVAENVSTLYSNMITKRFTPGKQRKTKVNDFHENQGTYQ